MEIDALPSAAAAAAAADGAAASSCVLDPNRELAYNLSMARFYDLPRADGIGAFPEKAGLNQYWFNESTVAAIRREIEVQSALAREADASAAPLRVAFVSTPSIFFAIDAARRLDAQHALLEIDDEAFGAVPGFVKYDHCQPEALPSALHGCFDMVVLDPPLISAAIWELTARAARLLLGARGRMLIATTVPENAALLARLFGARRARYLPIIEHLVHQFRCYTAGFSPRVLCEENPEMPGDGTAE